LRHGGKWFDKVKDMATAKKKTTSKKAPAKKAPAKKAPAKKAAPKSTFAKAEDFIEEIAAKQVAEHADKIEQLIDSIPAQVSVDARGLKRWLRKFFKRLSK
jgi:uncharacterized protein YaaR (DUF327 family)